MGIEYLKCGTKNSIKWLMKLFRRDIKLKGVRGALTTICIVPLCKSRDNNICLNKKGIRLDIVPRNMYAYILLNRVVGNKRRTVEIIWSKGCMGKVYSLNEVAAKYKEGKKLFITFMNLAE